MHTQSKIFSVLVWVSILLRNSFAWRVSSLSYSYIYLIIYLYQYGLLNIYSFLCMIIGVRIIDFAAQILPVWCFLNGPPSCSDSSPSFSFIRTIRCSTDLSYSLQHSQEKKGTFSRSLWFLSLENNKRYWILHGLWVPGIKKPPFLSKNILPGNTAVIHNLYLP